MANPLDYYYYSTKFIEGFWKHVLDEARPLPWRHQEDVQDVKLAQEIARDVRLHFEVLNENLERSKLRRRLLAEIEVVPRTNFWSVKAEVSRGEAEGQP